MDEGHGQWGQMGIELGCKAWLSGGRLVTNKNTWFAHFFRGGGVPEGHQSGFPYRITQRAIDQARDYSEDLWLNDKWHLQKRPFEWLVHKFKPPTWKEKTGIPFRLPKEWWQFEGLERIGVQGKFFKHIHREKNLPIWRGIPILKMPSDLINYAEAIQQTRPEVIVEIGTKYGGSALYCQDMLDIAGGGFVVTIDIKDQVKYKDGRIRYIIGNSLDDHTIHLVNEYTKGKRTMLIIDGNHNRRHVKWELHRYRHIVTPGCYLVVEDCFNERGQWGPKEARDWFLENYKGFEQTKVCQKFIVGVTMGGWLKRAA
jgi:cephalosporin hydroxylase